MFYEELTGDELDLLEANGRVLLKAAQEIRALRGELAAFDRVRRHLDPDLLQKSKETVGA